jgi:cell division protein FtsB
MHAILVAYVNAIKEQQAIIQAQKSEIEQLKQNYTALKAEIDAIKSRLRGDLVNPKEINPNY